ncbi:MAG TPA: succinyldiaminopimelate transaminase [Gammaproteobacteria bacterium]|nr:succinyldiaminopimelate transaminase [Gammaproteobacteria bacterium]
MNPNLNKLKPYPFEKLATLKAGITPPAELPHIAMSIGEPQHAPPDFIIQSLHRNAAGLASYPQAKGLPVLREAIVNWLNRRFSLPAGRLDAERHVLPVSGTREGLFAFAQAIIDPYDSEALVLMPNPFYQIYEGAAYLAGATPYYLNTTAETNYLPDFSAVPENIWRRCRLLYLCSPGNPTGAVITEQQYQQVLELADKYDFIVAADECYAELYQDEATPPVGLLEVCANIGRDDFKRCVVFHSLSKRSNVPGLRSGFVAGDADIMARFALYRTYHGCALPVPAQLASVDAWNDDAHVTANRALYRKKFADAAEILTGISIPPAAFYLWLKTPIDDEHFSRELFAQQNVTTLPGSYLSRDTDRGNPGKNHVRISLVPDVETCAEALRRIGHFMHTL